MAITVTQLVAFLAVVRGGSVTAAADELMVTQPSVSSAIAALAREVDCDLFERAGRGIRLTEAGEAFAPYAADVIGLLDERPAAAREAAAGAARRLRIAAVTTAAESFVPDLMQGVLRAASRGAADAGRGQPPGGDRARAAPPGRRRGLRQAAGRRAPDRRAARRERDRADQRARRPGRRRRADRGRGARRPAVAAARARVRDARAQRAVPGRARSGARPCWSSAPTARSSRRPAPGSACRCCRGPRSRPSWRPDAGRDQPVRRAPDAPVVRAALRGRARPPDVAAFLAFTRETAALR